MKKNNLKKIILFCVLLITLFISFNFKKVEALNYTNNNQTGNTQAILNGTINPNGFQTIGWFEYSTQSNFSNKFETERKYVGTTSGSVAFSEKVSNLIPNTKYYFRIVANNGRNTIKGNTLSFITIENQTINTNQTFQPIQNTNYAELQNCNCYPNTIFQNTTTNNYNIRPIARLINPTAVELNASLTNNSNTFASGYFEWGNNPSFGNTTPIENLNVGFTNNISKVLENLNPNTTYYYKVVFIKNNRTYSGDIQSFQTGTMPHNINYNQNNIFPQNQFVDPYQTGQTTQQINQNYNFPNPQNEAFQNRNIIQKNQKLNTANSLFGNDFTPQNILGWLIVLLLFLSILFIIRKIIKK